jgi:hypothetical protein
MRFHHTAAGLVEGFDVEPVGRPSAGGRRCRFEPACAPDSLSTCARTCEGR